MLDEAEKVRVNERLRNPNFRESFDLAVFGVVDVSQGPKLQWNPPAPAGGSVNEIL
jgi:hypothetical protein